MLVPACSRAERTSAALAAALRPRMSIVSGHLAPAFDRLLEQARPDAEALAGYDLGDAHALLAAPDKTRKAYLRVREHAATVDVLRSARGNVNRLAGLTPRYDDEGMFAVVQRPHVLWPPLGSGRPPALDVPAEPAARLVWLCGPAAPAGPWLPTVAQQDQAWHDSPLGERHAEAQRNKSSIEQFRAAFS